jgi:hypothetical protein
MSLLTPLFLLGFTAIIDHLRTGEVLLGCGPQSSAAQSTLQSVSSWAAQSAGGSGFTVGATLSKWTAGAALLWVIPKL